MLTGTSLEEKIAQLTAAGAHWPIECKVPTEEERRRRKIVVLSGPTGCGKTALSLLLAEAVNGEIISADSMQIYRGMDIGTAKPTSEERQRVPHHLIDVREVTESFSVVDYYYEAQQAIEKIEKQGKIPIIVGGSGFYLHALLYGPPAGPPSVKDLRSQLESELLQEGADEMYRRLAAKDPDYAMTITPNDRHKIVRALEIIALTGYRVSSLSWKERHPTLQGEYRCWFIHRPRPILYRRVEERCDEMVSKGLIEEVERLEQIGLRQNSAAAQAIGYRQGLAFLEGSRSPEEYERFINSFKQASRHYVKRQFTWFRREPLFAWLDAEVHEAEVLVDLMARDLKFI